MGIALCTENAKFLCHEPVMQGGQGVIATEDAKKLACNLDETQDAIYELAEDALFFRLYKGEYTDDNIGTMRKKWKHQHNNELMEFFRSCHIDQLDIEKLPDFDMHKTIFHYVTGEIAEDKHHKLIEPYYMKRLGLLNEAGVNLHIVTRDHIEIGKNEPFKRKCGRKMKEYNRKNNKK